MKTKYFNGMNINGVNSPLQATDYLPGRTTFSNAAYTMLGTEDSILQVGTMSAPRALTLADPTKVPIGKVFFFKDESGSVTSTNKVTAVGVIDGATNPDLLAAAYANKKIYSNGTAWLSF